MDFSHQPFVSNFLPVMFSLRFDNIIPGCTETWKNPFLSLLIDVALSILDRFITCPPLGTAPAARPVLAPCIVMGISSEYSSFITMTTSFSFLGKDIVSAVPEVLDSSFRYSRKSSVIGFTISFIIIDSLF